jgi:hypothetical protein
LKERSLEKNTKVGEMTNQMVKIISGLFHKNNSFPFQLEDMYEQAKEILQINLQINLIQLEEEKAKVKYFFIILSQKKKKCFSRKSKFVLKNIQMDLIK